jgi:hypothetical protein
LPTPTSVPSTIVPGGMSSSSRRSSTDSQPLAATVHVAEKRRTRPSRPHSMPGVARAPRAARLTEPPAAGAAFAGMKLGARSVRCFFAGLGVVASADVDTAPLNMTCQHGQDECTWPSARNSTQPAPLARSARATRSSCSIRPKKSAFEALSSWLHCAPKHGSTCSRWTLFRMLE